MPDKLIIHDLVTECRLGVYDWEQAKPQTVWISLELAIDAAEAAAGDDLSKAVDYGRLVSSVKQLVEHKAYRLMETMADEVAQLVLKEFATPRVTVRIKKRALPGMDYAAVDVTRP